MPNAQRNLPGMRGHLHEELPEPVAVGMALVMPGVELKSLNKSFRVASRGAMYAARASAKRQRQQAALVCWAKFGAPPKPPLVITITRVGPRELDSDNLAGSAKHTRDGIADWLGVDDGDKRLAWVYRQSRGPYAVGVRVERGGP